jgi:hypothetical protein
MVTGHRKLRIASRSTPLGNELVSTTRQQSSLSNSTLGSLSAKQQLGSEEAGGLLSNIR